MSEKKAPTLQHPFIDGLRNPPENRLKELKKIRNWLISQPHLPHISDDFIYLFLHSCYYHVDRTKHTIESYFTIRGNAPALFANRDVYSDNMEVVSRMAHLVRLPKTTPEGYKVLMYVFKGSDPADFIFNDAVKGFAMYNDCMLSEDSLVEGYVVIFDMKNVRLGHVARASLPVLRTFMAYIQEAHPARLKAIHIINTLPFIKHIMRILTPMIRSEIFNLLNFHSGMCPQGIPPEIMPMDYGGEAPTVEELGREVTELRSKYAVWMRETEYFVADESRRLQKNPWWSVFSGSGENPNPNDLGLIESPTFKNLEVD